MGAYDDLLADVSAKKSGAYDDLLSEVDKPKGKSISFGQALDKGIVNVGVLGELAANLLDKGITSIGSNFLPEPQTQASSPILHNIGADASLGAALGKFQSMPSSPIIENVANAYEKNSGINAPYQALKEAITSPVDGLKYLTEMLPSGIVGGGIGGSIAKTTATKIAEKYGASLAAKTLATNMASGSGVNAGATFLGGLVPNSAESFNGDNLYESLSQGLKQTGAESVVAAIMGSPLNIGKNSVKNVALKALGLSPIDEAIQTLAGNSAIGKDTSGGEIAASLILGGMGAPSEIGGAALFKENVQSTPKSLNDITPEVAQNNQFDAAATLDALNQAKDLVKPRLEISNGTQADDALAEQKQAEYDAKTTSATPTYDDLLADVKGASNDQSTTDNDVVTGPAQEASNSVQKSNENISDQYADDSKTSSLNRDSSWVVRDKETGEPIMETFQKSVSDKVNTDKYEVVPVAQHLQELNQAGSKASNYAQVAPNIEKPAKTTKPKEPKQYKPKTLLSTLRDLGGIALTEKQDVTGEVKSFAPGGYNQVFKQASNRSLKGLIESGDLDDYLPYGMRLESNGMNDDAFDSTEAYDYLADKIRNGESVLPYAVVEEAQANQYYQEAGATAESDVQEAAELLTEDEINEQLAIAANEERETATEARIFNTDSENGRAGSSERETATAETNASQQAEVTNSDTDLLGDNTTAKQAIADAERAKDSKRNSGNDNQNTFTLTGSNSEADQAAAFGAQDLFAAPIKQQSNIEASAGADVAENTANQSSNSQANDEVDKENGRVTLFSRSPMKSTNANASRGEASMNEALLNKADVSRAMYHNELGWIDFVWGDDFKGIKHIIKRRMIADGMTESEVYKLLTKDLVKTIASGEVIRSSETERSKRLVIRGDDNEAVLVKSKAGNGWVVTGFKLNEQVNQSRGATASDLRSSEPIRSRFSEVAVLKQLSNIASQYVNPDKKEGSSAFSRDTNSSRGLSKQAIQNVVNALRANWKNAPEIIVVHDMSDQAIPEMVRAENERQLSQGAEGQPEGFFDSGKVYVVASEMATADDVQRVIFHETLGHFGLQGTFGNALNDVLDKLYELRRADVLKKAKQYGLDFTNQKDRRIAAEEVLAEMAQNNPEIGFVKRAIAAIRQWLRDNGFNVKLSDSDIIANYLLPARDFVKRGNQSEDVRGMIGAFSRADQTNREAFKKWFGDSKVVDKDGKPLVVYHGTDKSFTKFKTNQGAGGELGTGSYFTPSRESGSSYAEGNEIGETRNGANVMPVYLSITNPFDATNVDSIPSRKNLIKQGYDGIIDDSAGGGTQYVAFNPTQIKSAIGNNGNFDGENSDIRFNRTDGKHVTVDTRDNWLFRRDELGNVQLAPTGKAYDFIANISQNIANKANFGMASPELRRQIRHFKTDMQKALDVAENVAHGMQKMTPEDRALVSDVIEDMLKTGTVPPQHVLDVAANMQSIMDTQTDELVKLGMLNKDAAERWRGKYLPRFYNREQDPALSTLGQKLLRTALPVRGLGGGSLKGRGLYKEISVRELPNWEALGWEVRDTLWKKNRQGKLELIDPNKVRETDNVVIWRDYTPKERETMGENRDAMFRFVMGYTAMQNDIALGRLFDGIASNQEWTRSRASEGYTKVPDSEIAETGGVKKYGNLAGLYVRDDIMQHITQYEESGDLLKYYRKALSFWKAGKTVLNPVSHLNNVVSNLTMAHFAGVSYWDTHKYVGALRDFVKNAPMIQEAKDVGLMTGDITRAELIADMPADIKAMMNSQDSKITKSAKATYNIFTFGLTKPMSKAYRFEDDFFKYLIYKEARSKGVSPDDAVDYATKYIFNYDDLPKGARAVRDAAIPFFAYTYKAIPALSHTVFNYPWRFVAPAAAIYGLNALAYGLIAGDDEDDLAERYAKGKQLEEAERKNLPPWMQGKSALGTEKTIRLGTDEKTGLPIYLDVSRFIPGGDMFDVAHGDFTTLPAPITPSNPVLTTISALMPQINKDMFTGKDIIDKNDTPAEAAKKRASWLIKQISPAVAPTGYHAEKLANAGAYMADTTINIPFVGFGDDVEYTGFGKDGLPVQPKYAAMNVVGIKARPTDLELSAEISKGQDNSEIRSIKSEIKQAARLRDKGAISQRAYDKTEAEAMQKIDSIINKQ